MSDYQWIVECKEILLEQLKYLRDNGNDSLSYGSKDDLYRDGGENDLLGALKKIRTNCRQDPSSQLRVIQSDLHLLIIDIISGHLIILKELVSKTLHSNILPLDKESAISQSLECIKYALQALVNTVTGNPIARRVLWSEIMLCSKKEWIYPLLELCSISICVETRKIISTCLNIRLASLILIINCLKGPIDTEQEGSDGISSQENFMVHLFVAALIRIVETDGFSPVIKFLDPRQFHQDIPQVEEDIFTVWQEVMDNMSLSTLYPSLIGALLDSGCDEWACASLVDFTAHFYDTKFRETHSKCLYLLEPYVKLLTTSILPLYNEQVKEEEKDYILALIRTLLHVTAQLMCPQKDDDQSLLESDINPNDQTRSSSSSKFTTLLKESALRQFSQALVGFLRNYSKNNPAIRLSGVSPSSTLLETTNSRYGMKRECLRIIATILLESSPSLHDFMREIEAIPVILDHCSNLDAMNPFMKEWAIVCVRLLCRGSVENQNYIQNMKLISRNSVIY